MELKIILIAVSIGVIWVLRWVWNILNWVYLKPKKLEKLLQQQGLKGNPYKLVFGDMIDNHRRKNEAILKPMQFSNEIIPYVEPFLYESIKNHGENAVIWFGPVPLVTITQPELIKEVFCNVNDFPKPDLGLAEILIPGVPVLNGEKWAKHRKFINPAFHMDRLKLMMPSFISSCNEMMNEWEKMVTKTGSNIDLDLWPQFVNMMSEVIAKATFGTDYEQGRRAFEFVEEQTQIFYGSMREMFIPGWRYVPTNANRRFNKLEKQIRDIVKGVVDKRRIEKGATKNDFLDIMMENNSNEMDQHGKKETLLGLTVHEVIGECKTFYIGGQESTTVLLAYTMILLAKHKSWQTRAREEVVEAFGKRAPNFDGLNKLKTVAMILYEVLRLYPSVPLTWRKVIRDTKLGKWYLPEGTYLNLAMIYSHHNPRNWGDDAIEFNPDRFSGGISEATKEKFAFTPFGLGPRACVGKNLALLGAKMALTMILQRFSFEPSPSYAHSPFVIISIRPQFGAHVILHPLD